jgi:hypothetical protein
MEVLSLAIIPLVACFLVWLLTYCLRMGVVGTRNGPDVHRANQPIRYWIGIAALALGALFAVAGSVYVAWLLIA